MEEVIHYLDLKNQYYEKFYSLTSKFLVQAEQDHWNEIEFFVDNRERILNIIRSFDFKIAAIFDGLDMSQNEVEAYRERVKTLLDKRAEIANKIVAKDLELIAKMDEMKSETIRELKKTMETSHQVGSFLTPGQPRRALKTKDA